MPPSPSPSPAASLADRLLDAQVAFHLDRLSGEHLEDTVGRLARDLLDATAKRRLDEVADPAVVTAVVVRALTTVPGSAAVRGIVELVTTVVHDGPAEPFPLGDLADRAGVARLVDELLALHPVLERALERLTDSPLVGTMAARFMGRIVGEVVQANRTVADKVPGLGSLMSLGTSAASRAMGAADKQLEALIGGTVGKGSTYAVRRLNKIVIETLRDPTTRDALLQVWDLLAAEPVAGLGRYVEREELDGLSAAVLDLVVSGTATEHAADLAAAVVAAFFDRFGALTPAELLDELGLDRSDVVADLVRSAPPVLDALRESGDLEQILRGHLAPFFGSDEVAALLG